MPHHEGGTARATAAQRASSGSGVFRGISTSSTAVTSRRVGGEDTLDQTKWHD